ncbi:MAG TPA: SbcC/MukB-like Walker B domain-containing protein, partial [Pseudonocardia sp.]|nr:SbcC/MukB-like Walker B domain-containing protein [Pseudonocardia sp.]
LPEVSAAAEAVARADDDVATLEAEHARLGALVQPDGLEALDRRRRDAEERVRTARARFSDGEAADDAARKLLADAPDRRPLDRARREYTDLAAALATRPAAAEALEAARAAEEKAAWQVGEAEEAATAAVAARDSALGALGAARSVAARAAEERALLVAVRAPAGLDVAERRRAEAVAALDAARGRLDAAESADAAARERLAAAPERAPLEQARRDHVALASAAAAEPEVLARHRQAADARTVAAAAVIEARAALATALGRRDAAVRGDLAAALRPSLVVGEPCPVCTQEVAALPAPLAGVDVAALESAVAEAQAGLEEAVAREADAVAAERQAEAERDRLAAEVTRLRAAVAAAGRAFDGSWMHAGPGGATRNAPMQLDSGAAVDAVLAELDAVAAAAGEADSRARTARRARDEAASRVETIQRDLAAAAGALRAARDPLVPLGAPGAADDPVAGWSSLLEWVGGALAEREAALPSAERAEAAAAAAAEEAARAAEAAGGELAARRRDATAAARAEQQARGRVEVLDERVSMLRVALADAPPADQVDADLARLDDLEASARSADTALRDARTARAAADDAAEAVRREVTAGWESLRGARDPLVALGAPAAAGDDLAAAWSALTTWAARESADRQERFPGARAAAEAARSRRAAVHARLEAALAADGVAVNGAGGTAVTAEAAVAAVAAALAHAKAVRERLVERRAEAAGKRTARAEADEAQQVARMLGGLLRSDRFPRWLVASALDTLVADASAGLAELSGGQFELTHEEGEFLVVDHADADARRPVKTLSGGETFQASLALALALSAQISTLAAEGAARLDSIFLDEGFGTLDEANLDVVASTLENLAGRGDRMVGVITHVPGLAERVPVRFAVRRDQRSARIEREG